MAYEIDYLPVGEGEKAGDCIALRFWNNQFGITTQRVFIIDGGFKETGEAVVEHVKKYYGTNRVDLVISTHPDSDHSSGLSVVLEKMEVSTLLMHRPWEYAKEIKDKFKHPRITTGGIESRLEESLFHVSALEDIAIKKNIPIHEPFSGVSGFDGKLKVLGPDLEYYKDLIPHFRGTPEPAKPIGLIGMLQNFRNEASEFIKDHLSLDLLNDDDTTSPENNSSTIILLEIDGHKILLTSDAGITAMSRAINYAQSNRIILTDLKIFDVPHHGSKRNLGKTMMKSIKAEQAYISTPKDSEKHPAKKVTNHLNKIGMKVFQTKGFGLCFSNSGLMREGWGPASEIGFYDMVEN